MNQQQIERLTERAAALPAAIQERAAALAELRAQLEVLQRTSCTGTVYWRKDENNPKMYANHPIDTECPIHGKPQSNKRLRSYIGTDPDRQAEAEAAIEREKEREQLQAQVSAREWSLTRLGSDLRSLFYTLGYTHPDDGPPEPNPEWRPGTRRRH